MSPPGPPGPPPHSNLYCQPAQASTPSSSNQHLRSRQPPDSWKNEPGSEGSRNTDSEVSGNRGNRRYVNGHHSAAQSQSSGSDKNGEKSSSPSKVGGGGAAASSSSTSGRSREWSQNSWNGSGGRGGGQGQCQYIRGPPPPNTWNSSGSPTNWNGRRQTSGPPRGSPSNSSRQTPGSARKEKNNDGEKDKGRGSYRCGKVRLQHHFILCVCVCVCVCVKQYKGKESEGASSKLICDFCVFMNYCFYTFVFLTIKNSNSSSVYYNSVELQRKDTYVHINRNSNVDQMNHHP